METSTGKPQSPGGRSRALGIAAGVLAAIFYGTNPLGTLPLYQHGVSPGSVLFYRYGLAALMFLLWLALRRESPRVRRGHAIKLSLLGAMFGLSSATLYLSFRYMDAGVASTILFSYPIITALLMVAFYHERLTWPTTLSIALALLGIGLLYRGGGAGGGALNATGMALVLLSSLLYALYIVYVNQFHVDMSPVKFTFWVILFGWLTIIAYMAFAGDRLQWLHGAQQWGFALQLALLPTVLSVYFINVAIRHIGSTPTAIMGALEPLTAVAISCLLFGEQFTPRLAAGILLILSGVTLVILKRT